MRHIKFCLAVPPALGILVAMMGCGGEGTPAHTDVDQQTRVVMNFLATLYGEYLNENRGVPPKDEAAFRKYLESRTPDLPMSKVVSLDELLTSPRDGQPFTVVCGKRLAPAEAPESPWAAYEKSGVNGKRMAVRVRGGAHELSPEEFAEQFPAS